MSDQSGGGQLVDALGGDVMQLEDVAVCAGNEGVGRADDSQASGYGRGKGVLHSDEISRDQRDRSV